MLNLYVRYYDTQCDAVVSADKTKFGILGTPHMVPQTARSICLGMFSEYTEHQKVLKEMKVVESYDKTYRTAAKNNTEHVNICSVFASTFDPH